MMRICEFVEALSEPGRKWTSVARSLALMFAALLVCKPLAWSQTTFPTQIGVEVADRPSGFIDAFKHQGRLFINSSGSPLPTDANGNPLSDGVGVIFDNRPIPEWLGYADDPSVYQPNCAGTYVVSFQGQATLGNVSGAPALTFANQTYNSGTNTTTVNVTLPGGSTYSAGAALMEISFTNTQLTPTSGTNTGIASLQAIRPGFTATQASTQVFDPAFVSAFAPFGYLRFMGWSGTNTSPGYYGDTGHHLLPWSSRSLPTDFYQGVGTNISTNANVKPGAWGVSWEYVILLANATNKDIWINVPVSATGGSDALDPTYVASPDSSSYIYNLAYLLKNGDAFTGNVGLKAGLHIYIEHSNEVWNSGFLQYTWNLLAAEDEVGKGGSVLNNDGDTAQLDWAYRRHIKRLYEIGQIFQSVFGAGSLNTTIRPVYAWWQLDEGTSSNAAKALAWFNTTYGPPANYFYALAQSDYFNATNYSSDTTISAVLSDMASASTSSAQYVTAAKATATQYGLQLFAYEGGPANNNNGSGSTTNVGVQILANRDPGMDTLVQNHIRTNWFGNGGNMFGYFGLSSAYSRYGDWGATDDYTNLSTVKYNALVNLIGYEANGVPVEPGDLLASPGDQTVSLSWEPVPGAGNYVVLRGTASGGEAPLATVSSTTFSDFTVANGTAYYYEVKATNSTGTSGPSNEVSATPFASVPPSSTLTAAAGNSSVSLGWTTAARATSYNIYQGTSSGNEGVTPVASGITGTAYSVGGLTNGVPYYFEVAGVDAQGTGALSNEASATPAGPTSAPTGLTAAPGDGQTVLTWAAVAGASSYNVYEGSTSGGESTTPIATGIPSPTFTATGLTDGATYFFTVASVNASGVSGYSNEASVTPSQGSLLAYEPFGEATGALNGASGNGDSGWAAGWAEQTGSTAVPGYNVSSSSPLTYTGLKTSGNYGVGGYSYEHAGRALNVTGTGPFASYLSSGLIGASGKTIWISFLLRKDVNDTQTNSLALTAQGGVNSWWMTPTNIQAGYFGTASNSGSTPYWSLHYNTTTLLTNVPVVVGTPVLLVMQITFGATNVVNLYVNPSSLGAAAPATPSATYSTTSSLAFQSLTYYGGDGTGQSSIDEIRVGSSFAVVTAAPPAAPTTLTAAAGSGQATLNWAPAADATSYNVYEGTVSGGESATPIATGVTSTSYTATGLTNGTAYYFKVVAVNSVGMSSASNEATAIPMPPVPLAPSGLSATYGNAQATLIWTSVAGATSYNVYKGTSSGGESATPIVTGLTSATYTATGLTNGTTYYFKVAAVNMSGTSGQSAEISVAPSTIPEAPVLTATSGNSSATLNWNASSGATSYSVYEGPSIGQESTTAIATGVTATTYSLTGLTNATPYFFKVAAVSSAGTSALSNEAVATPTTPVSGTPNSAASFSIFPQVLAATPVNTGFNMQPGAGSNVTENAWLANGGFAPYDERLSLTASQNGTATTFVAASSGGTSDYSSLTTGYFVGAIARTYRFSNGAWSLLRTDTVSGYTAVSVSDTTPADNTITFANSGPATQAGDVIWLCFDAVPAVPGASMINSRLLPYNPNWGTETLTADTATAIVPYTLSTDVPSSDSGGLSLEITDSKTETQGIWQWLQGVFRGPAQEQFKSGDTYEVNVWLKQSGISNGSATFSIPLLGISHTFTGITSTWQQFTWTFPAVPGVSASSSTVSVHLDYSAPGTLWVDNFQLYDTAWAPNTVNPQVLTAWKNYQPGTVRIWSNFGNTGGSYSFWSLDSWITPEIKSHNTPGIGSAYEVQQELEHLPDALANAKTLGANPWLIVNMALSEAEWGELIDYLAAPAGVGYASKRPANHPGPYTSDFSTIYLEVGNEEWATQIVPVDTEYGQWAHFVFSNATTGKSYFNASQIKLVVNGWEINPSFGSAAAAAAPEASVVDTALYSYGNTSLSGDSFYQSDLVQMPVTNGPLIDALYARQQQDAANGRNYTLAAYEEGPGVDTGTPLADPTLAAAIGAMDINLYATMRGFGPQNFFGYMLGNGAYTSHTNMANGFRPHPVWEALQMRNNYCTGPMVLTTTNSVPTYSDATITGGNAVPLIGVYTFKDTNVPNQADVVVISRDLNHPTPVTLNFPATPNGTATLYTLTGDPRATNDDEMNIPIGVQTLSGVTASYTFNMPPGSMYILQVPLSGTWSSTGQPTPPPPASLTASPGNQAVTLTWPTSTAATGYNVLRGTASGGPYTQIGTSSSVVYKDSAVTNGTTYYYVVQATNGSGTSSNSPQASATPNVEDDLKTSTPPPLDGSNTGAWTSVPFVPLSHYFSGTSQDTAQYKTLWDANYLYLLVSVQDSYLIAPTAANIWNGETVEVYFSGTYNRSTTYGATDYQYAFPYGSGGAVVVEADHSPASLTNVVFAQQNITGGYQMLMAFPWTTLGVTPATGQTYGFDVMVDTASAQGTRQGKIAWWATCDCTWDNPSNMGPLLLTQP